MMIILSLVYGETKVQRGYSLSLVSMALLLELESKLIILEVITSIYVLFVLSE